jgi:phosphopantothenoylcysteine synthetase/decarboxylase
MKIIVTCGPSYEPIDGARRLTNMSTGRLGVSLANVLTDAGHRVYCYRGEGSTFAGDVRATRIETFSTNDHLARQLELTSRRESIDAVFHAAALCDYRVDGVFDEAGGAIFQPKLDTRDGRLRLALVPARKVLPEMRRWFPNARIAGWKYELSGSREDAFAKAWAQLRRCETDACVLNGSAYGPGFAVCHADGRVQPCADAFALCALLVRWLDRRESGERATAAAVCA